ncbi:MAG: AAA family ATPase [Rhizomicrobium sp.]|nr:AAA family ATPase [Rhizomicrobium sp.]
MNERFHFQRFADLHANLDCAHLVKGLLPRRGLAVIWGAPKCGKSFWALDVALHIAMGRQYRDLRTIQGGIVYIALEGGAAFGNRIEAWREYHAVAVEAEADFHLLVTSLDLVADAPALISAIEDEMPDTPPVSVFIDTLNRSLHGSENSDEDMSNWVRAADAIGQRFGCLVAVVHHCGHEATRPRGHSSLMGAADAQIAVKRESGPIFSTTLDFAKDMADGAILMNRIEPVDLGTDADGDPVSSCVCIAADGEAVKATPARRLSDRNRLALNALTALIARSGEPVPAIFQLPASVQAVRVDAWRDEIYSKGILDPQAKSPREEFKRVRQALQVRHLTAEREGQIWLTT